MRSVSISELKAKLSEHVRLVRGGERIIVTDRGVPAAALVPAETVMPSAALAELVEAGLVRPGSGRIPRRFWKLQRGSDPKGLVRKAVIEDRSDRV